MSASCFLVSTYLIWIFGSKLIQSNNQSRATLWVLDTCLKVGLRPLIIILITASLSSLMYNWDSPWEERVLVGTQCHFVQLITPCFLLTRLVLVLESSCWVEHTQVSLSFCDQVECCLWLYVAPWKQMSHRSRAGSPSIRCPASREMISDSVELWETDVCFLHIQLIGTDVLLPKIHKTLPEVDFESSRSLAKYDSWNNPSLQCCAVFPTWQFWREFKFVCRLSGSWVQFVTDLDTLFTDHKMSGRPIRAKYKHYKTICDETSDNSRTDSSSSWLN